MSRTEDSFNDAELAMLALEIAKDFKELSTKANVDPDDSFLSKFEIEPDIIHPSRSISYSDDLRAPPIDYSPPIHDRDHDEFEKLTIVSLSANDSLKSIPSLPQDTKRIPINIHQTNYHCGNTNWFTQIKNNSFSPQSSISIISPSGESVRNLSNSAYSTTKPRNSNSTSLKYKRTLSPDVSPLSDSKHAHHIDAAPCLSPAKSMPRIRSRRDAFKASISKRRNTQKTKTNKKRSKSRNRTAHNKFKSDELINTKRFYNMRHTKSLMAIPDDMQHEKKRSRSQHGRRKRKAKKKHRSDALYDIRYRARRTSPSPFARTLSDPKEPMPYFVKRSRAHGTHNTLIDLSVNEFGPKQFSVRSTTSSSHSKSTSYIHKTNNIRFLYCADEDEEKPPKLERGTRKEQPIAAFYASKSMRTVRNKKVEKQRRKSKLKMKAKSVGLSTNDNEEYMVELEDGVMVFISNEDDAQRTSMV
eukprot:184436_1